MGLWVFVSGFGQLEKYSFGISSQEKNAKSTAEKNAGGLKGESVKESAIQDLAQWLGTERKGDCECHHFAQHGCRRHPLKQGQGEHREYRGSYLQDGRGSQQHTVSPRSAKGEKERETHGKENRPQQEQRQK